MTGVTVWVSLGKIVYNFSESRALGPSLPKNDHLPCHYLTVIIFMQLTGGGQDVKYQMEGKNYLSVFDLEKSCGR